MKIIYALIACLLTTYTFSQSLQEKYYNKVVDKDSILFTLYDVISGEKTEERNWELFRYLFKKDSKLISTRTTAEGKGDAFFMSVDQYVENASTFFKQNHFFEREIYRKTESFGPIAHILSTYETFNNRKAEEPVARGINSIQLLNDGNRWWIITIYWSSETKENQIPQEYLPF